MLKTNDTRNRLLILNLALIFSGIALCLFRGILILWVIGDFKLSSKFEPYFGMIVSDFIAGISILYSSSFVRGVVLRAMRPPIWHIVASGLLSVYFLFFLIRGYMDDEMARVCVCAFFALLSSLTFFDLLMTWKTN